MEAFIYHLITCTMLKFRVKWPEILSGEILMEEFALST